MSAQSPQAYARHLARVKPRLIQSQEEAAAVQQLIRDILLGPHRAPEDTDFLAFLGRLVLAWEEGRYPPITVDPLDVVKGLMEENGLKQQDLVGLVFPTKGIASEVLRGRRKLTYEFVDRLARTFNISPAVFYPMSEPQRKL